TANPAKPARSQKKQRQNSHWSNLFFFRRRPHLRSVSPDWDRPADDDAYQKMIESEGFVSVKFWKQDDISKHAVITHDLKDLEQYLLPTYFQFSQKSKFFQNQFYLYQWVFVWGAFLTTVFGTLSTLSLLPSSGGTTATTSFGITLDPHQVFSIL